MPPAESPTLNLQDIEETLWKTAGVLRVQFAESDRFQRAIREHLRALGHEV